MLRDYFLNAVIALPSSRFDCRLWTYGSRLELRYTCDPGYPKRNDQDPANTNRGSNVLTWRYTIPKGTSWGRSPANEVDLLDGETIVDHLTIPDLTPSMDYPTVLYLNLMLRR